MGIHLVTWSKFERLQDWEFIQAMDQWALSLVDAEWLRMLDEACGLPVRPPILGTT